MVHPDNVTAVAKPNFGEYKVTEKIRIENELGFLHVKSTLNNHDKLRHIKMEICKNRREVTLARMEAVAGVENPYSLLRIFGKGHIASRAGGAVYVAKCKEVTV